MSSESLESIIEGLLVNNYASLAMATVVVYDYILMFPTEVEHVWVRKPIDVKKYTMSLTERQNKPWTWVSTLFVLIRYLGLYIAMGVSFIGTTFIPGPVKLSRAPSQGTGIIVSGNWAFVVFLAATDLVMTLRVYAMWNRSKIILGILLILYVLKVVIQIVGTAILENPDTYSPVVVSQVLDYSVCYSTLVTITPYFKYSIIVPTVFDVLLLILALIPTTKQSITMYKATKQWQPNRYMMLIVREGVFYIFLNSLNNVTNIIEKTITNPLTTPWLVMLGLLGVITLYPIIPRFVLSVRELYERDSRGRWQGIDTGFGVSSRTYADRDPAVSDIAFADVRGGRDLEGDEEIQLEQAGGMR